MPAAARQLVREVAGDARDLWGALVAGVLAASTLTQIGLLHGASAARLVQDVVGAWPLALLAVALTRTAARRLDLARRADAQLGWTLVATVLYAAMLVPGAAIASWMAGGAHGPAHLVHDASAAILVSLFVLGTAAAARPAWALGRAPAVRRPARTGVPGHASALPGRVVPGQRRTVAATACAAVLGASLIGVATGPDAASAAPAHPCDAPNRTYEVEAISLDVPFNRWGDVNPNGRIFVLSGDSAAVKNWHVPLGRDDDGNLDPDADPAEAGNRRLRPRPLVLRANAGECVEVTLTNRLDSTPGEGLAQQPRVSMHVHGPSFDVHTSDGSRAGYNDDSTVRIGETITYRWLAPNQEGIFLFRDLATSAGSEADGGSVSHGLYGAFVVEPAGSSWYDPVSGLLLYSHTGQVSGDLYLDAVIVPNGAPAFRESVQVSQDEIPSVGLGFNLGVEPLWNRTASGVRCPDCESEETWLSSWPYGDPGAVKLASGPGPWPPETGDDGPVDPEDCGLESVAADGSTATDADEVAPWASCWTASVVHAYPNDPMKVRFLHAGPKETHVFHLHAHQWRRDPNADGSQIVDSQTFGPGEGFTAELIGGAGSTIGTVGDSIFHCHLYPHFAEGFWALLRVHDVLEDGSGSLPDGMRVRALAPLPDRDAPPEPTEFQPGFPRFIPGRYGWRAAQPPGSIFVPSGQPDDPNTPDREDLAPAPRALAGRLLDPTLLEAVQTVTVDPEPQVVVTGYRLWLDAADEPAEGRPVELAAGGGTDEPPGDAAEAAPTAGDADADPDADPEADPGGDPEADPDADPEADPGGDPDADPDGGGTEEPGVDGALADDPDPGTFVLVGDEDDSGPIAADVTTDGLQQVLDGWLGQGVLTVSGSGDPNEPWVLSAGGAEGALSQPAGPAAPVVTLDASGLTAATAHLEALEEERTDWALTFTSDRYGQEWTDALPVGAEASAVEAALAGLDGVEQVRVAGDDGGPYDIELRLWSRTSTWLLGGERVTVTTDREELADPQVAELAYLLAVERHVMRAAHGIDAWAPPEEVPPPGAPLVDPCPAGAREVVYDLSVIQLPIVYNDHGWTDHQGRVMVLDDHVDDVLAGRQQPEPLFFRVNVGDCIVVNTTNRLPDWVIGDDFVQEQLATMFGQHVHLVKFDVLASDGSSNGWNYQGAAFSEGLAAEVDAIVAGEASCDASDCRYAPPPPTSPTWSCASAAECPRGQTITARWYADTVLETVFTHDHHFAAIVQNRGLFGALIVEPPGYDFRDPATGAFLQPVDHNGPRCGLRCRGAAVGSMMDLIGPGTGDDFREFGLAVQDFVSLHRPCSGSGCAPSTIPGWEPVQPPDEPEPFPEDDPGVYAISYRNEPLRERVRLHGEPVDPAYWFSSTVYGDPATPLLRAYAGDPVRMRVIQGSHEEQHVFQVHGMRWRADPEVSTSPWTNTQAIGVSEAFGFRIPPMDCARNEPCQGDHLYGLTSTEGLWLGAWGILRVHGGRVDGLLALPDNVPRRRATTEGSVTGRPPQGRGDPGRVCPNQAPVRRTDVIAVDTTIAYDDFGTHDPYGLVFAQVLPGENPAATAARVRSSPRVEPMVLRAVQGECLRVRLHNLIDPAGAFALEHAPDGLAGGDGPMPDERSDGTPAGLRVSLHPALVHYDVRYSDGAVVGFNADQTVAPGTNREYHWYADEIGPGEVGGTVLTTYGDVRGHRHHGLFAGLVVEPPGATWTDQLTGADASGSPIADIRLPGGTGFRELVLFFQDGLTLRDASGELVPTVRPNPDPEDAGHKAFNYGRAGYHGRLGLAEGVRLDGLDGTALAHVFSSEEHGDPPTPILRGYLGDPARIRILQGGDRGRQHAFQLAGHAWHDRPFDEESPLVGTRGGLSTGRDVDVLLPALGGPAGVAGDHRYACGVAIHHLSGGLWGLVRLYEPPDTGWDGPLSPLAEVDDPRTQGYRPVQPLDRIVPAAGGDPGSPDPDPGDPGEDDPGGPDHGLRVVPSEVQVIAGTRHAGDASSLAEADGDLFAVDSTAGRPGRVTWDATATVTAPSDGLGDLTLRFAASADAAAQQRSVLIFDTVDLSWVTAISGRQRAEMVTEQALLADGARFVHPGTGLVRVRVVAQRSQGAFRLSTDLLELTFTAGP